MPFFRLFAYSFAALLAHAMNLPPLAVDSIQALVASRTRDTFVAVVTLVDTNSKTLTKKRADAIVKQMCIVIDGTDCVYEIVTQSKGSTSMFCAGYVARFDLSAGRKLRQAVDSCAFQRAISEPCGSIKVDGETRSIGARVPSVEIVVPGPSPGAISVPARLDQDTSAGAPSSADPSPLPESSFEAYTDPYAYRPVSFWDRVKAFFQSVFGV